MPEEFPIDTDGLLGWDMLTKHQAKINAANKRLEVGWIVITFEKDEQFVIPSHARQVIYARVRNTEDKIGFVALQGLGTGLLFGNFVAENKDGKAYALCYNIGDEPVTLSPPLIRLEPCEIKRVNVLRGFTDKDNDRTARILRELDPDTLKGLNEEEIEHIRNLINERPHPPAIEEEMQRQINKYLDEGIIRPSDSPYSSMMWVVPKKTGKNGEKRCRMVTDFRQLNEVTVGNSYPLPLTTDIIDAVAMAKYITAIDLKTGFYQILMDPADVHKTAFAFFSSFAGSYGHYEYTRMSMGLRNALATFQSLMDLVLSGLQG